jgi:hypothetical protein
MHTPVCIQVRDSIVYVCYTLLRPRFRSPLPVFGDVTSLVPRPHPFIEHQEKTALALAFWESAYSPSPEIFVCSLNPSPLLSQPCFVHDEFVPPLHSLFCQSNLQYSSLPHIGGTIAIFQLSLLTSDPIINMYCFVLRTGISQLWRLVPRLTVVIAEHGVSPDT